MTFAWATTRCSASRRRPGRDESMIEALRWYGALALGRLYDAGEFLQVHTYEHVQRWAKEINNRPAVKRGRMVNRNWGEPEEQLPERHAASDFDR